MYRGWRAREPPLGMDGPSFLAAAPTKKGDVEVIAAVSGLLEDESSYVRLEAIEALVQLAEKDDADVITAVSARLRDEVASVRDQAVTALGILAKEGDAGVISAVCPLLVSHRFVVIKTLAQLVPQGDHNAKMVAVKAMRDLLILYERENLHSESAVEERREILKALAHFFPEDYHFVSEEVGEQLVAVLSHCLADTRHLSVRAEAVNVLGQLVENKNSGGGRLIAAVATDLERILASKGGEAEKKVIEHSINIVEEWLLCS